MDGTDVYTFDLRAGEKVGFKMEGPNRIVIESLIPTKLEHDMPEVYGEIG
ncbi:MAG: hypothetical protein UX35_C0016G0029 [Microgenomates group bacterium GW2011_GWA1_46_15]|nr:MAG: hypothetical protein UX35_C0016G0029 [Microgenomates group bacterium GW2011_GWA1_46_15]KKU24048.1 MAG: hypothetical protein UX36_C0002G0031 [Microgenomates group bacterium GW2011_GWC1_46_15]